MSHNIDWATLSGFKTTASLTGQTFAGGYSPTDITGWNITIPNSVNGAKYFVEACAPYMELGTAYRQLSLTYSNNTEFGTFIEQRGASDHYGMKVSGICEGNGSDLQVKLRVILNNPGTTSGRVDGGYIRWERVS